MKRFLLLTLLLATLPALTQDLRWDPEHSTLHCFRNDFKLIYVHGGSFSMGASGQLANDASADEYPVHTVELKDYYIAEIEVPQYLWRAVMGSNPSHFQGDYLPVENVSWNDCQEFVKRLSEITGMNFRLPTEAEWEYAARCGSNDLGKIYSGSDHLDAVAWYKDNSDAQTHNVKQKYPNQLGLYNMTGNVWEWCEDRYTPDYSTGPTDDSRVFRGGSYTNIPRGCRVSQRNYALPHEKNSNIGLRLAMTPTLIWDQSTTTLIYCSYRYRMMFVEGGTFQMGNNKGEKDEKPVHSVTLDDFYIGQNEVPQWLWDAVMSVNPSCWRGGRLPVETVSWDDCQRFISKLNELTGLIFKLPTEAQWEFAAKGGNINVGTPFANSKYVDEVAWYAGNSEGKTHGYNDHKFCNYLGLNNMSGNVWEWCQDWYNQYSKSAVANPCNNTSGSLRICRGGGWNSPSNECRVTFRGAFFSQTKHNDIGFRLAM